MYSNILILKFIHPVTGIEHYRISLVPDIENITIEHNIGVLKYYFTNSYIAKTLEEANVIAENICLDELKLLGFNDLMIHVYYWNKELPYPW